MLHCALSDGERYDAWLALRRGEKRIAVGARSAIFAPLANLGAIIVDEEHEGSYKKGETPRYHAREVAMVRARAEGAVVVLGSATPSLESWENAAQGKYTLLSLPERVGAATAADAWRSWTCGTASGRQRQAAGAIRRACRSRYVFSEPLEAALGERLQQAASRASCCSIAAATRRSCSATPAATVRSCPNCSITLTYHRSPERLICHYCLHEELPERACRKCGGATRAAARARHAAGRAADRASDIRTRASREWMSTRRAGSGRTPRSSIASARGEVDILLGTQMIAKGLDFPNVTLVGVIDADVGINLPDFRASERSFQLLSQVAGRAGRGPKGGEVIIQTRVPDAPRGAVRGDARLSARSCGRSRRRGAIRRIRRRSGWRT